MALTDNQRILLQTNLARDKAEALLEGLLDAQSRLSDARSNVGTRAMQNAVRSTRRAISQLNEALAMTKLGRDDEACLALDRTISELNAAPRMDELAN